VALRSGIVTKALFDYARKHERLQSFLRQGQSRAVLRSAKKGVDGKVKAIRGRFAVPRTHYSGVNEMKRKFRLNRHDRKGGPEVIERIGGRVGIPLRDFAAKEVQGRGVTYKVRKGGRSRLSSAFMVSTIGGHVFTRKGKSRLPIKKRYGPGLKVMADNPAVREAGIAKWNEHIDKNLRKEEDSAWKRARLR